MTVDLPVVQPAQRFFKRHRPVITPLRLSVIKNRRTHCMLRTARDRRDAVHIFHQFPEMPVLRVMPMGIEMRRKVLPRERVRNKIIDSAHHEMIRQIFLQMNSLLPSVIPEDLTHGISLLPRLYSRGGTGQRSKTVVIELSLPGLSVTVDTGRIFSLGQNLAADIIDPRHILSFQSPKIMAQAGTRTAVLSVVLDHMPDVSDPMLPAPVADLAGEIFPHQPRQDIHIGIADSCRLLRVIRIP